MAAAEVGDDGFGDDPTVRRLEEAFAARVGKEAALFVPSGVMANQIALRLLGRPGTRVLVGAQQHIVTYEQGAAGMNASSQLHLVADVDGTLDPAEVALQVEAAEHHWAPCSAVFVENTHMPTCGSPWPLERLQAVAAVGLPMHLDGARLFNAEVATGVPAAAYSSCATTVMCCLSKGLGAPIGSLLASTADLIAAARDERKRFGGTMRQVGVLAAPGLLALANVERLADDHRRARRLAEAAAERWPGSVDPGRVRTNIVVLEHQQPGAVVTHFEAHDVWATTLGPRAVRLVTHLDVDDAGIERACIAMATAP